MLNCIVFINLHTKAHTHITSVAQIVFDIGFITLNVNLQVTMS